MLNFHFCGERKGSLVDLIFGHSHIGAKQCRVVKFRAALDIWLCCVSIMIVYSYRLHPTRCEIKKRVEAGRGGFNRIQPLVSN